MKTFLNVLNVIYKIFKTPSWLAKIKKLNYLKEEIYRSYKQGYKIHCVKKDVGYAPDFFTFQISWFFLVKTFANI